MSYLPAVVVYLLMTQVLAALSWMYYRSRRDLSPRWHPREALRIHLLAPLIWGGIFLDLVIERGARSRLYAAIFLLFIGGFGATVLAPVAGVKGTVAIGAVILAHLVLGILVSMVLPVRPRYQAPPLPSLVGKSTAKP